MQHNLSCTFDADSLGIFLSALQRAWQGANFFLLINLKTCFFYEQDPFFSCQIIEL